MPTDRGCEIPYILIFQKLLVLKSLCNDTNIYAAIPLSKGVLILRLFPT